MDALTLWNNTADAIARSRIMGEPEPEDGLSLRDLGDLAELPDDVQVLAGRTLSARMSIRSLATERMQRGNHIKPTFTLGGVQLTTRAMVIRAYDEDVSTQCAVHVRDLHPGPRYMNFMYVAVRNGRRVRWQKLSSALGTLNRSIRLLAPAPAPAPHVMIVSDDEEEDDEVDDEVEAAPASPAFVPAAPAFVPAAPAFVPAAPAAPAPAAPAAAAAEPPECIICMTPDEEPGNRFLRLEPCHSVIHTECMVNLVGSAVQTKRVPTCPCTHISTGQQHEIMPTSQLLEALPADLVNRWNETRVQRQSSDLLRTCSRCRASVAIKPGARVWFCGNVTCVPVPQWGFCARCSEAIEGDDPTAHRCATPLEDEAFMEFMRKNGVHPCPSCRHGAIKQTIGMCNHMSCICGARFCAVCGYLFPVNARGTANYAHACARDNDYRINAAGHQFIAAAVRERLNAGAERARG